MILGNIDSTLLKLKVANCAGFLFEYSACFFGKPDTGIL
jgi:hypothetical protein